MLKCEDLNQVELPEYNFSDYDNLRKHLTATKEIAKSEDKNAECISNYDMAIHLSWCVQNLHKNFIAKLQSLVEYYNSHHKTLPAALYFEPSNPRVFPPLPKKAGDLPTLQKLFVHHANFYTMDKMQYTWKGLIDQYWQTMNFAVQNNLLDDCVRVGTDGCFDKCITDMGIWKTEIVSLEAESHNKNKLSVA